MRDSRQLRVVFAIIIFGPASGLAVRSATAIPWLDGYWISGGVGAGSGGGGAVYDFTAVRGHWLLAFRNAGMSELRIFGAGPPEYEADAALLLGGFSRQGRFTWAWAAGPALVGGVKRGELLAEYWLGSAYARNPYRSGGLALQGDLIWRACSWFGVGVKPMIDLNPERPFLELAATLYLGRP